jgi:predicted glycosyltransferase
MERKKIVYLLQNGIGYGHFRLALAVAGHFNISEYEIIFITQAKSCRIFDGERYKVYNFPMLYSLKSGNEILLFHTLLNRLLQHIEPDVVIEDTYPDYFYLNLPALVNVPRILMVNRLTASEFEEYYFNGAISRYDKLIVLKKRENFCAALTSREIMNFCRYSSRVVYYGDVFIEPDADRRREMRCKYGMDRFEKTLVVSCGAGGWHIRDNVCKQIMTRTLTIVDELVGEGGSLQLVVLTGPYSEYLSDELNAAAKFPGNMRIVEMEMHADALFAEADVTVLRPGYNSTMEALAGDSSVILLPGISYMEEQEAWCAELKKTFGIDYVPVNSLELLKSAIKQALDHPQGVRRRIENNARAVMLEIVQTAEASSGVDGETAVIVLNVPACVPLCLAKKADTLEERYRISRIVACEGKQYVRHGQMSIRILNEKVSDEEIASAGIVAVYHDERLENNRNDYFQKRHRLNERGIMVIELSEIVIRNASSAMKKLCHMLKRLDLCSGSVVLTVMEDGDVHEALNFLDALEVLLMRQEIVCRTVAEWAGQRVELKLGSYQWQYSRPETAKLK